MATKVCVLCVRGACTCEVFQKTDVDIQARSTVQSGFITPISHLQFATCKSE